MVVVDAATGPVRSQDDERSAVAETELDLSPGRVHTSGRDGSFEASLTEGQDASLARRPRSGQP